MRMICLAASAAAAIAATTLTARAGDFGAPVYGVASVPVLAPVGYVLTPVVPVNPVYVVNQGPVFSGPGIYTYTNTYYSTFERPTYLAGGYAYTEPYYVRWSAPYPYVSSYPYFYGRRGWRNGYYAGRGFGFRRYGAFPPHAAYRYRPVAGARVFQVPTGTY